MIDYFRGFFVGDVIVVGADAIVERVGRLVRLCMERLLALLVELICGVVDDEIMRSTSLITALGSDSCGVRSNLAATTSNSPVPTSVTYGLSRSGLGLVVP